MASNARGTVSVAVPVYNGERYLAEALNSVTRQSMPPDETLVFDNCSTDRSREIAVGIVTEHAVRTATENLGAVMNFNRAVRECSGEYFAWLAADDRLNPLFVERTVAALEAAPQAPACLPAIQFIDPEGRPAGGQSDRDLAAPDPDPSCVARVGPRPTVSTGDRPSYDPRCSSTRGGQMSCSPGGSS
jgi:glycosyltransferase involved in cell wall biosynthesis